MPHESNFLPPDAAQRSIREIEELIARRAALQKGVIDREQLLALGLSRHEIQRRIGRTLHRVFAGIYAVGNPRITREGRFMAAVLAGGPGFALSDAAAADLLGLQAMKGSDVDISGPVERRKQPGLRPHRRALAKHERTTRLGIPVTTPTRTIFDLAETLNADQLEALIRKAEYADKKTIPLLVESLKNHQNHRGNNALRQAIEQAQAGKGITREELERRFKAMLKKHKIPPPDYNAPVHLKDRTYEVDCLWRERKLIVELDGRAAHTTARAFEEDRIRDAVLQLADYRVIRVTWRRLRDAEAELAAQLIMAAPVTRMASAQSGND